MRTILAMGVAMLMLAGCPNYGEVSWVTPTQPTPTAPGPDMTGPSTPGPDMASLPTPPDMAVATAPDMAAPPADMTTSCPPDLSTTPTPDMTTVADLGGPSSDGGCMPLPPVGCDLDAADDPLGKITICHIPPGNPANRHTIVVGAPAASAHLAHGDYLGACKAVCQ